MYNDGELIEKLNEEFKKIIISINDIDITSVDSRNRYEFEGVFILMDDKDNPLYIGKTKVSIYARLKGNGSGSISTSKPECFEKTRKIKILEIENSEAVRTDMKKFLKELLNPEY